MNERYSLKHLRIVLGRSRSTDVSRPALRVAIGVAIFFFIGISSPAHAQTAKAAAGIPSNQTGSVAHGKELYIKYACYQCHGYEGQGGTSSGVRIAPNPLPYQTIAAYVRNPAGLMPPFTSKLLPDSDLQEIYVYLKSIPGPVDVEKIPTFSK